MIAAPDPAMCNLQNCNPSNPTQGIKQSRFLQ